MFFDVVLYAFTKLFKFHRNFPSEKICSVTLFIAGLNLRDLSERLCFTYASREPVMLWVHKFSKLFKLSRKVRRLITVDRTVLKDNSRFRVFGQL